MDYYKPVEVAYIDCTTKGVNGPNAQTFSLDRAIDIYNVKAEFLGKPKISLNGTIFKNHKGDIVTTKEMCAILSTVKKD